MGQQQHAEQNQGYGKAVLIIFASAFLLRLISLYLIEPSLTSDPQIYHTLARSLLENGSYSFDGRDVGLMPDAERTRLRQSEIGFVFQFFHLLPRLTAQGNVELPMLFAGVSRLERRKRAARALEAVGLSDRAHHRPDQLSGGQRQRVAIARAVVMEPGLLLADEPTGNLDRAAAVEVMELLGTMNEDGQTVVLVTHDPEVASRARSAVRMDDGAIVEKK